MSDSIEEESLMIVGGTQDTTEPLCLDGITFKGNDKSCYWGPGGRYVAEFVSYNSC